LSKLIKKYPFVSYGIVVYLAANLLHLLTDYDQGGIITLFHLTEAIWKFPFWITAEILPSFLAGSLHSFIVLIIGFTLCFLCDFFFGKIGTYFSNRKKIAEEAKNKQFRVATRQKLFQKTPFYYGFLFWSYTLLRLDIEHISK